MGDACGREDSFEGGVEALGAEPLPLLLGAPYFDVAQSAVARDDEVSDQPHGLLGADLGDDPPVEPRWVADSLAAALLP